LSTDQNYKELIAKEKKAKLLSDKSFFNDQNIKQANSFIKNRDNFIFHNQLKVDGVQNRSIKTFTKSIQFNIKIDPKKNGTIIDSR
jgi:hypothetical protein